MGKIEEVAEYLKKFINYYNIINNTDTNKNKFINADKFIKNYIKFIKSNMVDKIKYKNYSFFRNPNYDEDIYIDILFKNNRSFSVYTINNELSDINKYNKNNNIYISLFNKKQDIYNKKKNIIYSYSLYNNIKYKINNYNTKIYKKYYKNKYILKKKKVYLVDFKYIYINFYIYIYCINNNNPFIKKCKYYNLKNYKINYLL